MQCFLEVKAAPSSQHPTIMRLSHTPTVYVSAVKTLVLKQMLDAPLTNVDVKKLDVEDTETI